MTFPGGNRIDVSISPTSQGQGHRTVFAEVAADRLGIPVEQVTVTHGDSDRDVPGFGAVASRSAMLTGSAVINTADAVIAKGKKMAAILLQGNEAEVEYRTGTFQLGQRSISLFDVAERAHELARQGVVEEVDGYAGRGQGAAVVPQWLPHRRSRGRSADRGGRRSSTTPSPTIAGACSTAPSSTARCMAASCRGSARR